MCAQYRLRPATAAPSATAHSELTALSNRTTAVDTYSGNPNYPLAAIIVTQIAEASALAAVPVLAPEIAAQNEHIDASDVGIYSGLLFLAAMWTSSLSGWFIARLGAIRTNQIAAFGSSIAVLLAVSDQP